MIKFDVAKAPEGFSNRRAKRKIRYEMAVHDIDVKHLNAGRFDTADVFTQTCEIGGENGWKNLQHAQPYKRTLPGICAIYRFVAASSRNSNDVNTGILLGNDLHSAGNHFDGHFGRLLGGIV